MTDEQREEVEKEREAILELRTGLKAGGNAWGKGHGSGKPIKGPAIVPLYGVILPDTTTG